MTIHVPPGREHPVLRRFTVDDLRRMIEVGIVRDDESVELLDGELVEMAAKGYAHDLVKNRLNRILNQHLSPSIYLAAESTLELSETTLLEPDFLLAPEYAHGAAVSGFCTIPGPEILLVIEIAASSLAYDLGRKARLYARYGVCEYWVISAQDRAARVHLGPLKDGSYSHVCDHAADAILVPQVQALAGLRIALADLT